MSTKWVTLTHPMVGERMRSRLMVHCVYRGTSPIRKTPTPLGLP